MWSMSVTHLLVGHEPLRHGRVDQRPVLHAGDSESALHQVAPLLVIWVHSLREQFAVEVLMSLQLNNKQFNIMLTNMQFTR